MALEWLPVSTTLITPVLVQATANLPLTGLPTIDGVDLVAGDRVLVRGQTNPVQNGVYVAAAGPWTRAQDFGGETAQLGTRVYVVDGYGQGEYAITTEEPVVGSTPIEFISVQGAIMAGMLPEDGAAGQVLRSTGPDTPRVWATLVKADVGLGLADNTSDLAKPISNATLAVLQALEDAINGITPDMDMPVSTLQAAALAGKADNTLAAIMALMSQRPMFSVANHQGGSNQVMIYRNILVNIGGGYSATTGRFTCPVSGIYEIAAKGLSNNSTDYPHIRKNGNIVDYSHTSLSGYYSMMNNHYMGACVAGDYFDIHVPASYTEYTGDTNDPTGRGYSKFWGELKAYTPAP